MNLLLDTHVLIWWDEGRRLTRAARHAIETADTVYVSAASAWEVAIKASLGKIDVRARFADAVGDYGFEELPISIEHADAVRSLPLHHRDPFDRLLVAQALVEGLALVTRDPALGPYGVSLVWT